jgi:hypothetical protein
MRVILITQQELIQRQEEEMVELLVQAVKDGKAVPSIFSYMVH